MQKSLKSFFIFCAETNRTTHRNFHLNVCFVFSSSVEMYSYNFNHRILMVYMDLYLWVTEMNLNNNDNKKIRIYYEKAQSSPGPVRTMRRPEWETRTCYLLCFFLLLLPYAYSAFLWTVSLCFVAQWLSTPLSLFDFFLHNVSFQNAWVSVADPSNVDWVTNCSPVNCEGGSRQDYLFQNGPGGLSLLIRGKRAKRRV